jgi:hypothetical protein
MPNNCELCGHPVTLHEAPMAQPGCWGLVDGEFCNCKGLMKTGDSILVLFDDETFAWPGTFERVEEDGMISVWVDCHQCVVRPDQVLPNAEEC